MHATKSPQAGAGGRRRSAFLLAVVAALLVASGCSIQRTEGGDGGTGDADGTLTIVLPEEPRSLASWNAYSNDGHPVLRNVQEALVNRDPETDELVGELATSWEQVDDLTWRFELRQGVTFHDGKPFDAEAAAEGLNYVLSPENAFPMRTFLGPELEASAAGEHTLEIVTEAPDPILPLRLYFVTIPSMAAVEEDPQGYEEHPVGTGPYQFVSWNRGRDITLEANEDWWGREAPEEALGDNEDVTEVTYVFRPETEVRAAMVRTGEADFARWLTEEQCGEAPKCEDATSVETTILRLDTPNPALADPRVREAIALSFDKAQIINDIMGGGEVAAQIVGSAAVGFNDSLEPYPADVERAQQLIAEAKADGVPVDAPLTVAARDGFILRADETIQLIAEALRSIGLTNVKSEMVETARFEEQWTAGYDAITPERGLIGLQNHGNELLDFSSSVVGYYTCGGSTSAYCDPTLERMYEEARQLTGDARHTAFQEIAAYVHEQVPVVPIGYPSFYFGMAENVDWQPRLDGLLLLKEFDIG